MNVWCVSCATGGGYQVVKQPPYNYNHPAEDFHSNLYFTALGGGQGDPSSWIFYILTCLFPDSDFTEEREGHPVQARVQIFTFIGVPAKKPGSGCFFSMQIFGLLNSVASPALKIICQEW